MRFLRAPALFLWAVCALPAAELTLLPDHQRSDPFGTILAVDQGSSAATVTLSGARASYVSCQLLARVPEGGAYRLDVAPPKGLAVDLFREWFHFVTSAKSYYPDALIPVRGASYRSTMPEPDNRIARQTAQAFWLDIWIPVDAKPGAYETTATLNSSQGDSRVTLRVNVLAARVPAEDVIAMDHNTYGTSWFREQYPNLPAERYAELIHAYHRIIYEHRGVFHQLGYGHAGKVGPEFAPVLTGNGKSKHVADWTEYDRHYGPLFDGSAFAKTRRGAKPIPFVYLPVNPEWPASFINWGESGYEREFVNVLSDMERHFREKGWTSTRFELFFNHKKRYRGFNWDGDEARFPKDYAYMRLYAEWLKKAVPVDSPVKFVFRTDASWTMERQFRELAGVVNFWVCGGGMFGWYRDALPELKRRGDIVWTYGGTPRVTESSANITVEVLRQWLGGTDGFVRWLVTDPGKDPWFQFNGGSEALVYPGSRFGIQEPVPSIRLKIQRNAVQDINLLQALKGDKNEVARRFNSTTPDDWWHRRPAMADTDPLDWTNATIDDALPKQPAFEKIDAAAWQRVREYVLGLAQEVHP